MGTVAVVFAILGAALFAGAALKGRRPWYRGKHGPGAPQAYTDHPGDRT